MLKIYTPSQLLITFLVIFTGCYEPPLEPDYKETIIVNSFLYVGDPIDSVYVSRSLPIGTPYRYNTAAVSGAEVIVRANGNSHHLQEYSDKKGAYYVPEDTLVVTPGNTYEIEVHAGGHRVTSRTSAPGQVRISELNRDTTRYLEEQLVVGWEPVPGAKGYLVTTIAKPPYAHRIHIEGFIDSSEVVEDSLSRFSPVSNFALGNQDTFLEIPWFMFWYYGDYTLKVYAIDQNLYDVSTSSAMYTQSSEYEQPNYNMEGGLGIFAAVSVDSVKLHILRQRDLFP